MSTKAFHLTKPPIAKAEMLIRKPVADVFEAFVDPAITSKFWFTNGSGKLEPGADVQWDWEMYGVSSHAHVQEFEQNKRILVQWSSADEPPTTIEWRFVALTADTTFVSVTHAGFHGDGDEVVNQAIDSTEGFSLMLSGLKAFLEHNLGLNLVLDRFPEGIDDNRSDSREDQS